MCEELLETIKKYCDGDARIAIVALANVSGNLIASYHDTMEATRNFLDCLKVSITNHVDSRDKVEEPVL